MIPYAENLRRFVANSERYVRAPTGAQEQYQRGALTKLAEQGWRSAFWRERLAASGWAPGKPFDHDALRRLPPLRRAEAQEHYEAMKVTDPLFGKVIASATSGSTGRPVMIDRAAFQALHYDTATVLNHLWHRRDLSLKLGVIRTMTKTVRRNDWGHPMALLYKTGPSWGMTTEGGSVEQEFDEILVEKPAYLITQPGRLRAFARMGIARGGVGGFLKHVITIGETVNEELRAATREGLGAEIKDVYSTREAGYVALQCPDHNHYHPLSDVALVEVTRSDGTPVGPGEPGTVLVTVLHSYAMPTFRYEVGDIATVGERCDCGLNLPVIAQLLGRSRALARMPDGGLRYVQFPGSKFVKIAPIREYQLIQHGDNLMEVRLECAVPVTPEHEQQLTALIQDCIGFPIKVRVRQVDKLPLDGQGKREEFLRLD